MFLLLLFKVNEFAELFYLSALGYSAPPPFLIHQDVWSIAQQKLCHDKFFLEKICILLESL
jgi:hypothetical protein